MNLDPNLQQLIDERVKSGKYASPEDVVAAALLALDQQERFGDFATGELDDCWRKANVVFKKDGTLDGDEAFQMRQARRRNS